MLLLRQVHCCLSNRDFTGRVPRFSNSKRGKIGTASQLVRELPGIYSEEEVLNIINQCLDYSQQNSFKGDRVEKILEQKGFGSLFKN